MNEKSQPHAHYEKKVYLKHFYDSIALLHELAPAIKLLDIGAGAGFP